MVEFFVALNVFVHLSKMTTAAAAVAAAAVINSAHRRGRAASITALPAAGQLLRHRWEHQYQGLSDFRCPRSLDKPVSLTLC